MRVKKNKENECWCFFVLGAFKDMLSILIFFPIVYIVSLNIMCNICDLMQYILTFTQHQIIDYYIIFVGQCNDINFGQKQRREKPKG